jgi:hypothetical protein
MVEVIRQVQAEIHKYSSTDYDSGLAGIGTGVEYLAQNGFLEIVCIKRATGRYGQRIEKR